MSVAPFLAQLFESGRVVVEPRLAQESSEALDAVLEPAEQIFRSTLAGNAPDFSLPVARWAAQRLYYGCHFLVCRDAEAGVMAACLSEPVPFSRSATTDYSADLTLQYLPDLVAMARGLAAGDPLVEQLLRLGRDWPLSSVGISDIGSVKVDTFFLHPTLRQLYLDRILAWRDLTRLEDPRVADAARETLGAFPELCEPVAKHVAVAAAIGNDLAPLDGMGHEHS